MRTKNEVYFTSLSLVKGKNLKTWASKSKAGLLFQLCLIYL